MANVQDRGAPSTASVVIATAIVAGITGYFVGQAKSIGLLGKAAPMAGGERPKPHVDSDLSDSESESGSDSAAQGELDSFSDSHEECKLVLVVRTDLGMTKGKGDASCSVIFIHRKLCCNITPAQRARRMNAQPSAAAAGVSRITPRQ